MRRIVFALVAVAALAGVVANMAPVSGQADGEAAPIFGVKIPPGYRDWRLISVARRRQSQRSARHSGQRRSDQGLPGREASVPGRHNHCPAGLELRSVGGKQQSLWPSPIFRGRAAQERGSVHGQGLKKIRLDRRLGVRSIQRRQSRRRGDAQHLLFLPRDRQGSRLCLQPLRPLIPSVMDATCIRSLRERMAKVTYNKQLTALLVIDPYAPRSQHGVGA